ncbi:sterile alpha motif domain-containing protein 15-like [Convolutriloba macropyga]|uniref:sterile alpha motif domain-containing protein 15-like n=1 Tax=Convolutriloba macropyga TaxID=536237 RepID=UPI003F51BD8F
MSEKGGSVSRQSRKSGASSSRPVSSRPGEPIALNWSIEEVQEWVAQIGYPQYKDCFSDNFIDGRKLILMDCSHLPRIGITDFQHMKTIAAEVRELLGVELIPWDRSIADPPRDQMGLFLERKRPTGPYADSLAFTDFVMGKGR